ncbi:aldehyde dehydrogenase family protein [Aeromicrobium sp. CF3.5]|uniref:aldehyde dehydrogenase family protein n=1 Tax=Aeromicrobium sp. CF3.5 TaxID=3373078 RepID=UPI003EE6902A
MTAAVSTNPATGTHVHTYPFLEPEDLLDRLDLVATGQRRWAARTLSDRIDVMERVAALMREECERLATIITTEMGKPIGEARAEVLKSASAIDWFVSIAPEVLAPDSTAVGAGVRVHHRPLGVVLAVEPWNFPVWQVMRGCVGLLLAGNGYLVKPAPTTVGCAMALCDLFDRAGLDRGAFGLLNADHPTVASAIESDVIVGVTVTGSVGAGAALAEKAGREIKPSVLELGGSDAFIVLADANLYAAVGAAIASRFHNSGQVCIAAKRIIVEEAVRQQFTDLFVEQARSLVVGDPLDDRTQVGPLARADLRAQVDVQVARSIAAGAELLLGGEVMAGDGYFYTPTVLGGVMPRTPAFDEEIFGPVAVLIAARDADDALALANDSEFGLSASVWTADPAMGEAFAAQLEVGSVFVNKAPVSDPRVPIGGVKKSGYGRELSDHGLLEFTNLQTVWIEGLDS